MFGSGCENCPVGYARKANDNLVTQCQQCKFGETTLVPGAATCSKCDLGQYGSTKGTCSVCSAGKYQDSKGEKDCKDCEKDTYLGEEGKSSKADCEKCSPERSTGTLTSNENSSSCLCKRKLFYTNSKGTCMTCPTGANCSRRDGVPLHELVSQNGFWRPHGNSTVFSDCMQGYKGTRAQDLAKERCCPNGKCPVEGRLNAFGNATFNTTDDQCLDGYRGALCLVCAENFVFQSGECIPCKGGAVFRNTFMAMLSLCLFLFCLVCLVLLCSVSAKRAKKSKRYMGQLKILLTFIQILSSMPGVYDNVPWPEPFIAFTMPFTFFNLDLTFFLGAYCSLSISFLEQFIIHMVLPIFAFLTIYLANVLVSTTCKRKKKMRARNGQLTIQMMIVAVLLMCESFVLFCFAY